MLNQIQLNELIEGLQQVTLLTMDDAIQDALQNNISSIFDENTEKYVNAGEFTYTGDMEEYNVRFTVIKRDSNLENTIINVNDIEVV